MNNQIDSILHSYCFWVVGNVLNTILVIQLSQFAGKILTAAQAISISNQILDNHASSFAYVIYFMLFQLEGQIINIAKF